MQNEPGNFNTEIIIRNAVELMGLSARTAPKTAGKDFVEIKALYGEEVKQLGEEMKIMV